MESEQRGGEVPELEEKGGLSHRTPILIGLAALTLFLVIAIIVVRNEPETEDTIIEPVAETHEEQPKSINGRYLLNGTIFWGRGIEKWSSRPDGSYDYARPFSGLEGAGKLLVIH